MMAEDRDMEYRQVEKAVQPMLDRLNSDLLFHRLGIRSGYYDGIQVYVEEPSQDRWLVPELRDAWEEMYGEDSVPDDTRLLGVYADERTRIRKWLRDNLLRLGFHALRYTSPWTIERVENPSRKASKPKAKVPVKRSAPKTSSKTIKPKTRPKSGRILDVHGKPGVSTQQTPGGFNRDKIKTPAKDKNVGESKFSKSRSIKVVHGKVKGSVTHELSKPKTPAKKTAPKASSKAGESKSKGVRR